MIQVSSEIEEAVRMTLQGLDDSHEALEHLKKECVDAAAEVRSDIVAGGAALNSAVDSVHQFIVFEQQVVELFEVDAEAVALDDDSLWQAELDMHHLLVEFNTKTDSMDLLGVADLIAIDLPDLLTRFQTMLPVMKDKIEEAKAGAA